MNSWVLNIQWMVVLILFQVLVLESVHIEGYATPFLYIYFILKFHSSASRNTLMLWAFALGMIVDIFSNTPGVNAAASTALAFVRTPMLHLVTLRDVTDDFQPGVATLGISPFFRYTVFTALFFSTVYLLVDSFSVLHFGSFLLKILTDTIATVICVWCVEMIRRKDK